MYLYQISGRKIGIIISFDKILIKKNKIEFGN